MLQNITYFKLLGLTLLMYLGLIAFILLILAAAIAYMNNKGNQRIPLKYHFLLAKIGLLVAVVHVVLAVLARF